MFLVVVNVLLFILHCFISPLSQVSKSKYYFSNLFSYHFSKHPTQLNLYHSYIRYSYTYLYAVPALHIKQTMRHIGMPYAKDTEIVQ